MKLLAIATLSLVPTLAFPAYSGTQQAPTNPAPAAQAPAAQAPALPPELRSDIDGSVKWLRFEQDKTDGSYGKSVWTTAIVLRGMAECPRKYGRNDGPFITKAIDYLVSKQAADGSIADPGSDPAAIMIQTRAAAGVLGLYAHVSTEPALKKALAFVSADPKNAEIGPWQDAKMPESKDELAAQVMKVYSKRMPDGSWNKNVRETADNVVFLSRAFKVLSPPAPASTTPAAAPKPLPKFEPVDKAKAVESIVRGAKWLSAAGDKGLYGAQGKPNPGFTAMAIGGLLSAPEPREKQVQEAIDAGLAYLVKLQKPDGSIHDGQLANYTTSAAVLAFARSGKPEFKPVIEKAQKYLIDLQADEAEGYSPDHPYYGGNSYGDEQRPDLSNVQMALEALAESGVDKDNAAFQRALVFLQRCQNRSESNDVKIDDAGKTVVSGNDGGAGYAPGTSKAGFVELEGGKKVPVSYGSMTYALLKCYVFAGVKKDDPRMKACWEWLTKNYTLDVNPGFEKSSDPAAGYQGLYYYLHSMAKALDVYGEETITDGQGKAHSWRKDVAGRMVAMQSKDGSWKNENSQRWYEGNPVLATSYALMTLQITAK